MNQVGASKIPRTNNKNNTFYSKSTKEIFSSRKELLITGFGFEFIGEKLKQ